MAKGKKKKRRDIVVLACTVCKHRNYVTDKNRQKHPGRLERKKYCPNCNKRTAHRETK